MSGATAFDLDGLRRRCEGTVVGPGEAGWDTARRPWNTAVDQLAALLVFAAGEQDVAATCAFAAQRGLRVAPQANRSAPEHGAADRIDAPFLFYAVGTPVDRASVEALRDELDRAKQRLAASATGETLRTFAERQPGLRESFCTETAARLRDVSRRYDPDGMILANHAV